MPLIAAVMLSAVAAVTADRATHSVTFTACATDIDAGTIVEFAFVGPGSDRAYEALFMTDANVADIARAFDEAGIPRGRAVNPGACRFWPVGNAVTVDPPIERYLAAKDDALAGPIAYTGGLRDPHDRPLADTNMPSAVFALYSIDQSLMLLDNTHDQGVEYGKFTCRRKMTPGERHVFKVSWDGAARMEERRLGIRPGKIREAIESLKGGSRPLDVMPDFAAELTVAEAKSAAAALAVVDSLAVRINGFAEGQIFYRGFLPDELWRDRQKRLTQPLEVRLDATNAVCTVIDEDWSVEGDDPKLTPHEVALADVAKAFKGDACLFYAKPDVKLGRIYAIMSKLPRSIRNWYVFTD